MYAKPSNSSPDLVPESQLLPWPNAHLASGGRCSKSVGALLYQLTSVCEVDAICSGLEVWRANRTLKQALEQSLDYLALTDFLSTMWPCHGAFRQVHFPRTSSTHDLYSNVAQFVQYTQLRNELIEACVSCGISIPRAVPIPGVIGDKPGSGWMTPSPFLCVKKTDHPNDIPILAVD